MKKINIEYSILASIILKRSIFYDIKNIISPFMFQNETTKLIANNIWKKLKTGKEIDTFLLENELEGKIQSGFITELASNYSRLDMVVIYANEIKKEYLKNETLKVYRTAQNEILKGSEYSDVNLQVQSKITDISNEVSKSDFDRFEAIERAKKHIQKLIEQDGELTGIDTGDVQINEATGGFQKTDLIVLAARPSHGKTTGAISYAIEALMQGEVVHIISIEMSEPQILAKINACISRVPASKFRRPKTITQEEQKAIDKAWEEMVNLNFIIDTRINEFSDVVFSIRETKRKHDTGMVIIDYLQLMTDKSEKHQRKDLEVGKMTRELKKLAGEGDCNLAMILLSQLRRLEVERRPKDSDLRESGAIEQDADVIIFYYNFALVNRDENDTSFEVIVSKNRHGKAGFTIQKMFTYPYVKFIDVDAVVHPKKQEFEDAVIVKEEKKQEPEYNMLDSRPDPEVDPVPF
jgi:replicative DNA helicase